MEIQTAVLHHSLTCQSHAATVGSARSAPSRVSCAASTEVLCGFGCCSNKLKRGVGGGSHCMHNYFSGGVSEKAVN